MAGVFITFEGPEGCGKSTQVARLAERLRDEGYDVVTTREPGGTPAGEAIRGILQHDTAGEDICAETETLLFEASRAQLVRHVIRPAIERGAIVLCDRFADSTTAYQGYGRGFDVEALLQLHAFALGETEPKLTLLLDIDVEEGFRRLQSRNAETQTGLDRMERESRAFHQRVHDGYLAMADRWPGRFSVVDGNRAPEAVHADIWNLVLKAIRER
ncbi:MAG: dTMP kinase [Verrucomicrobia bacterium]|jgi:dTMP kinase|nr:dTMP kinase [Verrucomicrobiota bacterium]